MILFIEKKCIVVSRKWKACLLHITEPAILFASRFQYVYLDMNYLEQSSCKISTYFTCFMVWTDHWMSFPKFVFCLPSKTKIKVLLYSVRFFNVQHNHKTEQQDHIQQTECSKPFWYGFKCRRVNQTTAWAWKTIFLYFFHNGQISRVHYWQEQILH